MCRSWHLLFYPGCVVGSLARSMNAKAVRRSTFLSFFHHFLFLCFPSLPRLTHHLMFSTARTRMLLWRMAQVPLGSLGQTDSSSIRCGRRCAGHLGVPTALLAVLPASGRCSAVCYPNFYFLHFFFSPLKFGATSLVLREDEKFHLYRIVVLMMIVTFLKLFCWYD